MLYIASDHGGYELKRELCKALESKGIRYEDLGCDGLASVDYPDYAKAVCQKVAGEEGSKGVLICGTGVGMSVAANKCRGIRAALVHEEFTARMSRMHNDANVLCLGARVVGSEVAKACLFVWLETKFEGGRHCGRLDKITAIEAEQSDCEKKGSDWI
jgi:ribose 5-phosphate isomerase B